MTETRKLLHADVGAETYRYEIEETSEHLTVATISRGPSGGWRYEVTARRIGHDLATTAPSDAEVHGTGGECATPDEAVAAARAQARSLLAEKPPS